MPGGLWRRTQRLRGIRLPTQALDSMRFSPPVAAEGIPSQIRNPKRARRAAKQALCHTGTGTKSQQALQMQRELGKQERKKLRKQQSEEEKARRFALRQQRKKEKHRGR